MVLMSPEWQHPRMSVRPSTSSTTMDRSSETGRGSTVSPRGTKEMSHRPSRKCSGAGPHRSRGRPGAISRKAGARSKVAPIPSRASRLKGTRHTAPCRWPASQSGPRRCRDGRTPGLGFPMAPSAATRPPVWSLCPWLRTMASAVRRSLPEPCRVVEQGGPGARIEEDAAIRSFEEQREPVLADQTVRFSGDRVLDQDRDRGGHASLPGGAVGVATKYLYISFYFVTAPYACFGMSPLN